MSFHAEQMHKRYGGIQKMHRGTADGEVTLMRVGDIEYIDVVSRGAFEVSYVVNYYNWKWWVGVKPESAHDRYIFLDKNKDEGTYQREEDQQR